ncbi:signal peptidase II [Lactiplantibacillus plantarum]|uniref:signal peptidase II n=1 Tax=Lactiplantibacillus plantarum TaxID=1590 RepID=UPI001C9E5BFE|nr:signal peptidase II [Lactiplantibacillus plantarum]
MPPLLVGGAQLQRRNQFAVALQFRLGQDAGLALVGAVGCLGLCRRTRAHWQNRWYFPAFNLADSAITVGAVMLALDMFRSKKSGEAAHG